MLERASHCSETGLRLLDRHEEAEFYPYPEIWRRALGVCGGLHDLGVEPGDRVALVYPTSIEFIDAFFGTILAGAVPVPLYPPVRLHRLRGVRGADRTHARCRDGATGARRLPGPSDSRTCGSREPSRHWVAGFWVSCPAGRGSFIARTPTAWPWCSSRPAPPWIRNRWPSPTGRWWPRPTASTPIGPINRGIDHSGVSWLAALPRHGSHRLRHRRDRGAGHPDPDSAGALPRPAGGVAAHPLGHRCDHLGGAEFRLRSLRRQNQGRSRSRASTSRRGGWLFAAPNRWSRASCAASSTGSPPTDCGRRR